MCFGIAVTGAVARVPVPQLWKRISDPVKELCSTALRETWATSRGPELENDRQHQPAEAKAKDRGENPGAAAT